jgi:D-arabinose 5-phosphate isomerase GutQ
MSGLMVSLNQRRLASQVFRYGSGREKHLSRLLCGRLALLSVPALYVTIDTHVVVT